MAQSLPPLPGALRVGIFDVVVDSAKDETQVCARSPSVRG